MVGGGGLNLKTVHSLTLLDAGIPPEAYSVRNSRRSAGHLSSGIIHKDEVLDRVSSQSVSGPVTDAIGLIINVMPQQTLKTFRYVSLETCWEADGMLIPSVFISILPFASTSLEKLNLFQGKSLHTLRISYDRSLEH